ncbi:MAG: XrtA system polysaccharide chain length determinant [Pseudomonadota bacterium]
MEQQVQAVVSQLRSAWRFRWWAIGVAWLVCTVGWAWVATQPDVYRAETRVYIDTSSSLERVLNKQIVPADTEAQLRFVRQSLLGTIQLEKVARANDLHLQAVTPADIQRVVARLRQNIQIRSDGGGRRAPDNLYTIRYKDRNPDRAVSVVTTLLNTFVEDTRSAELSASDVNQDFLRQQISDYEDRLRDAEDRLARFKRENAGRLPGNEGGYFQRLQAESEALELSRKELALAQSRRQRIIEQVSGESAQTSAALVAPGDLPPTSLEARIADGEAQLETLLLRFTERHPDVIALREQLDELNARLKRERAEIAASGGASPGLQGNPVFQALQISLNEVEVEIANLSADVSDRERKVADLRSLINEVPKVEAELARLDRDYEVVYAQYQTLLQSLETENLSTAAQRTDQIDFRIIDPPAAGIKPVEPQRGRLLAMVLIAGLGIGGGLALALSQVRPVFTTRRSIEMITGLPVLGAVSNSISIADRRRRAVQASGFGVVVVALLGVFAGVYYVEVMGPGVIDLVKQVARA